METQKKQKQSAKPQKTKSAKVVSIAHLGTTGVSEDYMTVLSDGTVWAVTRNRASGSYYWTRVQEMESPNAN